MIKITTLSFTILFASMTGFYSCEKDPDFEVVSYMEPVLIDNNNYFPSTVGNSWEYESAQGKKSTIEVKNSDEFNGERFFEINQIDGSYAGIRKIGPVYEIRLQGTATGGASYTPQGTFYKAILFDHTAPVGEVWESEVNYSVAFISNNNAPARQSEDHVAQISSKLIEKISALTINGTEYEDILKVQLTITTQGKTKKQTYHFSNQIGIVRYSEGIETVQLSRYDLK